MNDNLSASPIPAAPDEYNPRDIDFMMDILTRTIEQMLASGRIRIASANVKDLPFGAGVAPTGLSRGDLWWNTTTNTIQVQP
jgi:hypothetical protein